MKDLKYISAYSVPLVALISIFLKGPFSFITPVYVFVLIPILELFTSKSTENLDPETKLSKSKKQLFDWLLYLNLPIVYGIILYTLFVSKTTLATYEIAGIIFSLGIVLGANGINVAHELGHRNTNERFIAKTLLLPSFYNHFYIEHNFGHHLKAATKEDPATASYNQPLYLFWITSIFGQYISAWKIQLKLLKQQNRSFLSLKNDLFWSFILILSYLICTYLLFDFLGLQIIFLSGIVGFLLLETINYIEHYGLLRNKKASGRYERVKEIHSWNSNHLLGRILLFELTRHSDHHFKSSKKYQLLDHHNDSPQLPFGYPTSMVLAAIPPLWFIIMNKRIPQHMIDTK